MRKKKRHEHNEPFLEWNATLDVRLVVKEHREYEGEKDEVATGTCQNLIGLVFI